MNALKRTAVMTALLLLAAACGDVAEDTASLADETEDLVEEVTETAGEDTSRSASQDEAEEDIDVDGVDPESVAQLFAQAVAEGDYDLAAEIADQPALDFFEPWEPNPEATYQSLFETGFFVLLGPGYIVQCDFGDDGYVASCLDEGEGEPEYEEYDEPAQEDAIAPEHGGDEEEEVGEYRYDDPSNYTYLEYVFPETGGEAVVREGGIVRGTEDAYVVTFEGCCGDTVYASISSPEDNAVFYVYGPDGTVLASETTSFTLAPEQTGEYWFTIGASRGNAEYTFEVGLAQDAS